MRRKIELYIGGRPADLDSQGLILYNYAFTDLQNPTAVKNSFSKQVTLPATPRNLAIFGHPQRTDRTSGSGGSTGIHFNPGQRTPFELRDELGQVLESGYLRLDSTTMKGRVVQGLSVTFFGGLGAFFYSISYDEDGNKLTLADLPFGRLLSNFTINAATVSAAWTRLAAHSQYDGIAQMWDVLNFAPAYNGIPASDFAPGKAIAVATEIGVPDNQTDGEDYYQQQDGRCLVNLSKDQDEWAVKDLRCYLQRPVLSMRAFLEAVEDYAWERGFDLDISAIPRTMYCDFWKTLPSIPSLGAFRQQAGEGEITYEEAQEEGGYVAELSLDATLPAAAQVSAHIEGLKVMWHNPTSQLSYTPVSTYNRTGGGKYRLLIFMQMVALSGSVKIGGSDVVCICDWTSRSGQGLADAVGYTPEYQGAAILNPVAPSIARTGTYDYTMNSPEMAFDLQTLTPDKYRLYYRCYRLSTAIYGDEEAIVSYQSYVLGALNNNGGALEEADYYNLAEGASGQATYITPSGPRSGAIIDPRKLLESAYTPAEYLISFCKMHGLVFQYDPSARKVTIVPRNSFFGGSVIDLSGRVDRSKAVQISPLNLTSKWYEMRGNPAEGAFAKEYAETYGQDYGIQRVNTGYDFDAAAVDIMSGVVFKNAAAILDHSPYWNIIEDGWDYLPSILLDKGNTYTLWTSTGKTKEFQVPVPLASATIDYYNPDFHGYDMPGSPKLEFRDAEGKALDGTDVLCALIGCKEYEHFAITDDSSIMFALNNGVPCWDLTQQADHDTTLPVFSRYTDYLYYGEVDTSLDYGIPREVAIPDAIFNTEKGSIYLRYWKAYLSDLLGQDTKVMKCRVDFGGLQVGQSLLGRFFYYEGSIWVLNKITNYSLTTWDPVECEFVQVKNKSNYTNGQILN